MFFDAPLAPTRVKADPLSIESLIAWLEKQPADATYSYIDKGRCLLGQYFSAHGFEKVHCFGDAFVHSVEVPETMSQWKAMKAGIATKMPSGFDRIVSDGEWTFGAALNRARRRKYWQTSV